MAPDRMPTVVLADDEHHIRTLIKTVLMGAKMSVLAEAKSGAEAVALYREKRPDLLLLDINMPQMTGEEALAQVVKEFPGALVVMLSSVADVESIERCLSLGAANYIRKDTPIAEMKTLILETWQEHLAERQVGNA